MTQDSTVRAERSHYFDAGITQVVIPGLTVGVDAYYKISKNLIDEGQFGAPIILTAFNYAEGTQQGVELTASYDVGPWSLYANLARSRAMGKDINSAQYNFSLAELSYIQGAYIFLDHDQTWSSSGGAAYTFNPESKYATRVSGDILYQSGLRASTCATIPNGAELPGYVTVNMPARWWQRNRPHRRSAAGPVEPGRHPIRNPQRDGGRSRGAAIWDTENHPRGPDV